MNLDLGSNNITTSYPVRFGVRGKEFGTSAGQWNQMKLSIPDMNLEVGPITASSADDAVFNLPKGLNGLYFMIMNTTPSWDIMQHAGITSLHAENIPWL